MVFNKKPYFIEIIYIFYQAGVIMNLLTIDSIITESPKTKYSDAQIFLQEFTKKKFTREEAEIVWSKILDHKWQLSERLSRDVGLRVATIDYVEHFYRPAIQKRNTAFSRAVRKNLNIIIKGLRQYFEAKSYYIAF